MADIDLTSRTWVEIAEWARGRIEEGRDLLEAANNERVRGKVEAYRELLDLGRPRVAALKTGASYDG